MKFSVISFPASMEVIVLVSMSFLSLTSAFSSTHSGTIPSNRHQRQHQHQHQRRPALVRLQYQAQQQEEEDGNFLPIHESVWQQDPDWYQTYVLDILGKEYCQAKWPVDLQRKPAQAEEVAEEEASEALSVELEPEQEKDMATTDEEIKYTAATENETLEEQPQLVVEAKQQPPTEEEDAQLLSEMVADLAKTKSESEADDAQEVVLEMEADLAKTESETDDIRVLMSPVEEEATTTESEMSDTQALPNMETEAITIESEMNDSQVLVSTVEAEVATAESEMSDAQVVLSEIEPEVITIESRSDDAQLLPEIEPEATKPESEMEDAQVMLPETEPALSKIKLKTDTTRSAVFESEPDIAVQGEVDQQFVVYLDRENSLATIELAKLTKLGYQPEKIIRMQSDALAVILEDQVPCPRMGVPPQWKIRSGQVPNVQIVDNLKKAEALIEDNSKPTLQRRTKAETPQEPRSSSPAKSAPSQSTDNAKESMVIAQEDEKLSAKELDKTVQQTALKVKIPKLESTSTLEAAPTAETEDLKDKGDATTVNVEDTTTDDMKVTDSKEEGKTSATASATTDEEKVTVPKLEEKEAAPENGATTKGSGTEGDSIVVVYRNIGDSLQYIPMSKLTKLGYKVDEIQTIQSDALTVIVSDDIPRPRMGVPPQWKIGKGQSLGVQLVDTLEDAEVLVEADKSEKRRARAVETESIKSASAWRTVEDEKDRSRRRPVDGKSKRSKPENLAARNPKGVEPRRRRSSSERADADDELLEGPRRRKAGRRMEEVEEEMEPQRRVPKDTDKPHRPRSSQRDSQSGGTTWRNDEASEQDPPRRRQQRNSINEDGTPKRIFNAREPVNRKKAPTRSDPPSPDSPIWMDMDTFRGLLRNEAELRLRILGDDWAPTVRQEGDWRMNLYKDWLWTLHSGVGDSIVPPSRYERARKMRDQRMEDEEMPSPPPRSRPKKRNRPPAE